MRKFQTSPRPRAVHHKKEGKVPVAFKLHKPKHILLARRRSLWNHGGGRGQNPLNALCSEFSGKICSIPVNSGPSTRARPLMHLPHKQTCCCFLAVLWMYANPSTLSEEGLKTAEAGESFFGSITTQKSTDCGGEYAILNSSIPPIPNILLLTQEGEAYHTDRHSPLGLLLKHFSPSLLSLATLHTSEEWATAENRLVERAPIQTREWEHQHSVS